MSTFRTFKSLPAFVLLAAAATAVAQPALRLGANPGAVIAAELGFARLAQDKGQWTAFRATAAKVARMFAPGPVAVDEHLRKKADPAEALRWQPHMVWSSCDGSIAVTRGAWQGGGATGYFITVWQRQNDGGYKWVLDQGDALAAPLAEPDGIDGVVAECPSARAVFDRRGKPPKVQPLLDPVNGASIDGTLAWTTALDPAFNRHFTLRLRQNGALATVLEADGKAG